MKIHLLSLALATSALAQPPDWENPAVFRINKEAPRATSMPFPTKEEASAESPVGIAVVPVAEWKLEIPPHRQSVGKTRRIRGSGIR